MHASSLDTDIARVARRSPVKGALARRISSWPYAPTTAVPPVVYYAPHLTGLPALPALSKYRSKQDLPRRRVPEQCADQVAVVVELRRFADDRHDAVGAGEVEQRVDFLVAQAGDEIAQRALLGKLLAEPVAPLAFVGREGGLIQAIRGERVDGHVGAERGAPDAVVDPAAGRRLHEPGGVADDERAIGVRPIDRAKRQDLLPRRLSAVVDAPPPDQPVHHARVAPDGMPRRHDADAHAGARRPR